jgi:hypothetical protein
MDSKPVDLSIFQALSSTCSHSNAKVIVEIDKLLSSAVALTTTNTSHADNRVIFFESGTAREAESFQTARKTFSRQV